MSRLLRQMCSGLLVAFPLLVLAGQRWQHAAGGPGTQGVMAVAAFICPVAAKKVRAVRVADGAHALDRAVLRRVAMQLYMGTGCSVPVREPAAPADRRRDRRVEEKVREMGKSVRSPGWG